MSFWGTFGVPFLAWFCYKVTAQSSPRTVSCAYIRHWALRCPLVSEVCLSLGTAVHSRIQNGCLPRVIYSIEVPSVMQCCNDLNTICIMLSTLTSLKCTTQSGTFQLCLSVPCCLCLSRILQQQNTLKAMQVACSLGDGTRQCHCNHYTSCSACLW